MRWRPVPGQWLDDGVLVEDSVRAPRALSAETLGDSFLEGIEPVTFGLVRLRGRSLYLGPLELLRFGVPETSDHSVAWPITGGLLAAAPQGRIRVRWEEGRLVARVEEYRPSLPLDLYAMTQLKVHHAVVRLQLLRLRGRRPSPGIPADVTRRVGAGLIDAALCAGVTLALARKRRLGAFIGVATGYHIAAWASSGRTLGGGVMGQRVVAVDGSRPSLAQAVLRFALLPLAAVRMRAVHDEVAATDVVAD